MQILIFFVHQGRGSKSKIYMDRMFVRLHTSNILCTEHHGIYFPCSSGEPTEHHGICFSVSCSSGESTEYHGIRFSVSCSSGEPTEHHGICFGVSCSSGEPTEHHGIRFSCSSGESTEHHGIQLQGLLLCSSSKQEGAMTVIPNIHTFLCAAIHWFHHQYHGANSAPTCEPFSMPGTCRAPVSYS